MEASALAHASRRGLIARRSRLLKPQRDERLVAMIRAGHDHAFEALFDRYHGRLLAFCRSMLRSEQDAEDVLQEVFAKAHAAMLQDERHINVRPWLYRIARNRCLNHLRKPAAEGQDTMDDHPHENGATTAERVQRREELRRVIADVNGLPETQRTALLLREIDGLSYEEIAEAMDTTIPSVKSLLVRARITLAECSQARMLTCDEVRVELAEAAEGLRKASGPVRQHLRACEPCADFRSELRSSSKLLAGLAPLGPLALLMQAVIAKLGLGGGSATGAGGAGAAGGGSAAGSAAASGVAASGTAGGLGALGSAIGVKAAAGVATAVIVTAGAVEVRHKVRGGNSDAPAVSRKAPAAAKGGGPTGAVHLNAHPAGVESGSEAAPATNAGYGDGQTQATAAAEPETDTDKQSVVEERPADEESGGIGIGGPTSETDESGETGGELVTGSGSGSTSDAEGSSASDEGTTSTDGGSGGGSGGGGGGGGGGGSKPSGGLVAQPAPPTYLPGQ